MNYAEAAKLRKTGLGELITNRIIEGKNSSITRAVSDKMAARATGFKETFGLMNLAKVLSGGSNLAAAFMGKMTGAKPEDIRHVTGRKQETHQNLGSSYGGQGGSAKANDVLEKMLNFMQQTQSKETDNLDTMMTYEQFQSKLREDHHQEVMKILLNATLNKRKAEKDMTAQSKKREQAKRDKEALSGAKPEVTKPGAPAAPKPSAPAPKPATQAPSAPAPKPATQAPSAPAPKPATQAPSAPAAKPSANPVRPTTAGGTSTATKVGIGAAATIVATASNADILRAIKGAEGLGNYDISFGDVYDKKLGKFVNRLRYPKNHPKAGEFIGIKTPEEWGNKKLTEMTLKEVLEFGKYRSSVYKSSGAAGTYGFMPSTLFGKNLDNNSGGVVQKLGMSMNEKFTPANQDLLAMPLLEANIKILKDAGIPLTPGNKYMSWYIGPKGVVAIHKAIKNGNGDKRVGDVLTEANINWGPNVNRELNDVTRIPNAKSFESVLEGRLLDPKKGGLHLEQNNGSLADQIQQTSINNADMKKELSTGSGAPVIIIENTNNSSQKTVNTTSEPHNNVNPRLRR